MTAPLTDRERQVLEAVIETYVQTAEPAGSRTIAQRYQLGLSPATIRNTMSELEDKGYLYHPHTSAGRIPTDLGYRFFVDHFTKQGLLPAPQRRAVAAGVRDEPDDDDQATKYELADDRLGAAGLHWYEVSNWARPGEECRHNLLYWHGGEYVAIGCAGHGYTDHRRWWNVRTPERYVEAVEASRSAEAGDETLTPAARVAEATVLALRTATGIKLPLPAADPSRVDSCIDDLAAAGLLVRVDDRAILTRRGRLLGNEVAARLLVALDRPSASVGTR